MLAGIAVVAPQIGLSIGAIDARSGVDVNTSFGDDTFIDLACALDRAWILISAVFADALLLQASAIKGGSCT